MEVMMWIVHESQKVAGCETSEMRETTENWLINVELLKKNSGKHNFWDCPKFKSKVKKNY